MTERFGAMLKRLRLAELHPAGPEYVNGPVRWRLQRSTVSQNELARRAGVDAAYVHRCEAGTCPAPRRPIVERLADALKLDALDRARLLVAAGYWPWPEADELDLAVSTALAVIEGDYRPLSDVERGQHPQLCTRPTLAGQRRL